MRSFVLRYALRDQEVMSALFLDTRQRLLGEDQFLRQRGAFCCPSLTAGCTGWRASGTRAWRDDPGGRGGMIDFTRLACSAPPTDWSEDGIFRAAYLALFDPEDRAVLRQAGIVSGGQKPRDSGGRKRGLHRRQLEDRGTEYGGQGDASA